MKLVINIDFPYFHGGHQRKDYKAGEEVEAEDEEFIAVSVQEGWASPVDAEGAAEGKSKKGAPENKSSGKASKDAQ